MWRAIPKKSSSKLMRNTSRIGGATVQIGVVSAMVVIGMTAAADGATITVIVAATTEIGMTAGMAVIRAATMAHALPIPPKSAINGCRIASI